LRAAHPGRPAPAVLGGGAGPRLRQRPLCPPGPGRHDDPAGRPDRGHVGADHRGSHAAATGGPADGVSGRGVATGRVTERVEPTAGDLGMTGMDIIVSADEYRIVANSSTTRSDW